MLATLVMTPVQANGIPCVRIDVHPGSYPNPINLKSRGKVPVAICGSSTFDVYTVDPTTVTFAGASAVMWAYEDWDLDGYVDLVLHFPTQDLSELSPGDTQAWLIGELLDGTPICGSNDVIVRG